MTKNENVLNEKFNEFIYNGEAIIGSVETIVNDENLDDISILKKRVKDKEIIVVTVTHMKKDSDSVSAKVKIGNTSYVGTIPKMQVSSRMFIRNNLQDEILGQKVPVIITSFDEVHHTCELSRSLAIKELRKIFLADITPKMDEINKEGINYSKYMSKYEQDNDPHLKNYPVVKAKVMSYNPEKKNITVNIAGIDILGFMDVSRFDYKFIYDPETYIEKYLAPNTVIDVALLHYFDNSKEKKPSAFIVSRRHTLKNPWHTIGETLSKGDRIIVEALEKKDSCFFGKFDNFELDIKCYYPQAPEGNLSDNEPYGRRLIKKGEKYLVEIHIINEGNQVLTAKFIKAIG